MSRDEIAGPLDILAGDRPDDELVLLHGYFESEVGLPRGVEYDLELARAVSSRFAAAAVTHVGEDLPALAHAVVLLHVPEEADQLDEFLEGGVQHVIVGCGQPFDLQPIQELLRKARAE
jgi:hypothetical protein